MISGIILFAVFTLIAAFSYKRPRLEQRVIKNIPLIDWLNILFYPLLLYFALVLIILNILSRPVLEVLDFNDAQILAIGILVLIYGYVGNSIHFVGKVLSRYMKPKKHELIYQINEMFHGKLSHYMAFVSTLVVIFLIGLLEINHPDTSGFGKASLYLLIACGLAVGVSGSKAVFHASDWYGGYNKPLFLLSMSLLGILFGVSKYFHLKYALYPVNIFITSFYLSLSATFILKRTFRVYKLDRKGKLRFLIRLLRG